MPASHPPLEAEAARYALLRRLAPSMRHHLVVNLQPIGMIYEVMDRRLRAETPDLGHIRDSAGKINGFAKAALNSCVDVIGWLAPDETVGATVQDTVRECSSLLATSLGFRGYALRNEANDVPGTVRRSAIRTLLCATRIHCTAHQEAPADLVLGAAAESDGALVSVLVRPTQGNQGIVAEVNYRKLGWEDVQALAAAEGVALERQAGRIALRFPWLPAA